MISRVLGISARHLAKLGEQGAIQREKNSEGTWTYNVEEARQFGPRASEDVDYIEAISKALGKAQDHAVESFRIVHEPAKQILEFYKIELERARSRIQHLETAHDDAIKAREAAYTEAHQRELATMETEARIKRWNSAFSTLETIGPALFNQALETIVVAKSGAAATLLSKLISSLGREQLEALSRSEGLAEEERIIVRQALEALREAEQKQKEPDGART